MPTDDDIGSTIRLDESATEAGLTSTVDGRATTTAVFIPAVTHEGQSLVAGDSAASGHLDAAFTPSSCAAPKSAPTKSGNEVRFYDAFAVTSLINEPACVWVAQIPRAGGGFCLSDLVLYSPAFDPADLTKRRRRALSPPAAGRRCAEGSPPERGAPCAGATRSS